MQDVQDFLPSLMAKLHVEVLVHGNMTRVDAGEVAALARATLLCGSERLPVHPVPNPFTPLTCACVPGQMDARRLAENSYWDNETPSP